MKTYRIASIPGDGIGKEVVPEGEKLPEGFSYRSDTNDLWLTIDEIKKMTKSQ